MKSKKTKTEKGITLIALIITIVVLLILAAVAINSIQNDGILGYAQNAAKDYNQAVKNEQSMLQKYEDYLTGVNGGFDAYEVGNEVTIGTESFYVIKDSSNKESKVVLLAKYRIDTTTYKQSASARGVLFSSTAYWSSEFTSSPYDLVESGELSSDHYAAYHAYKYAKAIDESATGRLMTYNEAKTLSNTNDTLKNMIYGTEGSNGHGDYWLGSAADNLYVWHILEGVSLAHDDYDGFARGVRPVIEISKSRVTAVNN